jgi:hypothetical protein
LRGGRTNNGKGKKQKQIPYGDDKQEKQRQGQKLNTKSKPRNLRGFDLKLMSSVF